MAKKTSSGKAVASKAASDSAAKPERSIALAGYRESVESICVAIILALLFRSFVAEAFVIPTGSMAPTLMGAHKDLFCNECGYNFRVGASVEQRDPQTMLGQNNKAQYQHVVAGRCPNCRKNNVLSLASEPNHDTFSGDRILVSKFAYALQEPQRWDVIVFKFPGNPKQNYIKRLVGLPNETLRVHHGDILTQPAGSDEFTIARKPDHKILPTSHLVYDTAFQAEDLLVADYPSRLQPWDVGARVPPNDSWLVKRTPEGLTATVQAGNAPKWLRYFHNLPTDAERLQVDLGQRLEGVNPYRSQAITDFYPYDSYVTTDRNFVRGVNGFSMQYQDGELPRRTYDNARMNGAFHWVGDLTFEADLQTDAAAKQLILEIVEAGILYQCHIDLANGDAVLSINGEQAEMFDGGLLTVAASTKVRAGGSYSLRFSNVDQQLRLWVNGKTIVFNAPPAFNPETFATDHGSRPYFTVAHPLDAAPVGLAVVGGTATLGHFQLHRDQYYIATNGSSPMEDYDSLQTPDAIHTVLGNPELWDSTTLWAQRRMIEFPLEADQFFPMGDNSPESKDARCWVDNYFPSVPDQDAYMYARSSFVPRDLLVGKALLVFWPHPWNRPVPYTPNIKRMKLIR